MEVNRLQESFLLKDHDTHRPTSYIQTSVMSPGMTSQNKRQDEETKR